MTSGDIVLGSAAEHLPPGSAVVLATSPTPSALVKLTDGWAGHGDHDDDLRHLAHTMQFRVLFVPAAA